MFINNHYQPIHIICKKNQKQKTIYSIKGKWHEFSSFLHFIDDTNVRFRYEFGTESVCIQLPRQRYIPN